MGKKKYVCDLSWTTGSGKECKRSKEQCVFWELICKKRLKKENGYRDI